MVADRIFTAFNFLVEIEVKSPEFSIEEVCQAAFSECDGLEMTMEPKTFQQGGANTEQVHLAGPVTYSQLTLKRGMSKDFGLWRWFTESMKTSQRGLRGQATISLLDGARNPQILFQLKDCLPTKLRAPTLNATEGSLAIEEMQLVYAGMTVEFPSATGPGVPPTLGWG
jgi:phage tail-like protein